MPVAPQGIPHLALYKAEANRTSPHVDMTGSVQEAVGVMVGERGSVVVKALGPLYSASNRNDNQKHKNNNVSGE
jgi:hypothetical protein